MKTAQEEEPLGVITVLNLGAHAGLKALKQVKRFLKKACPSTEKAAALDEVGLMLTAEQQKHNRKHHVVLIQGVKLWHAGVGDQRHGLGDIRACLQLPSTTGSSFAAGSV